MNSHHWNTAARLRILLLALALLLAPLLGLAPTAHAASFSVTSTADSGPGSLRQAILDANATPEADTVTFNIPGTGSHTIAPISVLPVVTAPVTIDATTQPGASCTSVGGLLVELNGASAGAVAAQGGLEFGSGASGSTIKGIVINRFSGYGMYLNGSSNITVQCNYIGTDVAGLVRLGNTNSGIRIGSGNNNTIGGTTPGAGNVISGNSSSGIRLVGNDTTIQGNYIGINAAGTAALGNGGFGVAVEASANTIVGGTTAAARNVISGNGTGVFIGSSSGTLVKGNYIGTTAAGTGAAGNNGPGVYFDFGARNTSIGGTSAGDANLIAFNTSAGILIDTFGTNINNSLRGNRIHSNGILGIDLLPAGVNVNDAGDADDGPNKRQNVPIIASATATTISGAIDSATTNSAYPLAIDFYANGACDASGSGEGEVYLGATTVAAPGNFTFAYTPVAGKQQITATATDANGNTSEFSPCAEIGADTTPPEISPTVSGTLGSNGWYISDVTINWSVVDNESAISSQSGCTSTSVTSDTSGVSFTCSASSAGGTSSQSVTIKRDATNPTIAFANRTAPNAAGWNNSLVTVNWTCSDATSGATSTSVSRTVSGEGTNQSATATCTDNAGNTASDTQTGINIDTTAPTLNPVVSPNPIILGGSATVSAGATDALSGLASQSCGTLDTSSVGVKSVSCTASDAAGNSASASVSYTVVYPWNGFFQPIDNLPTVNSVKAGSAVPVKFSLGGNYGLNIFAADYPKVQTVACGNGAPTDEIEQTVTAGASGLTYDAASGQYSYTWKTDKSWAGSCRQLVVKLVDGSEHIAGFQFK